MAPVDTPPRSGRNFITGACFVTMALAYLVSPFPSRAGTQDLVSSLANTTNQETKAVLIGQLQFIAHDDAVPALAAYLSDERLCDPAARALVTVGTRTAAQALLHSLRSGHSGRVITVVQALGDLAYTPAIPDVQRFVAADDAGLRHVAWYTLARCGDRSLIPVLHKYRATDRFVATAELFRLARRLRDAAICRDLLQAQPTPAEHSQALETLAEVAGDGALPELREALNTPQTSVRVTAVTLLAEQSSSQARTALRDAVQNPDPTVRTAALAALVRLNDKTAQAACAAALSDTNSYVRAEAIHGWKTAPLSLLNFLPKASPTELIEISRKLQSVPPDELTKHWDKADEGMKVALLGVLSTLSGAQIDRVIWRATDDKQMNVRMAALASLKARGSSADLPAALALLGRLPNMQEALKAQIITVMLGRHVPTEQAGTLTLRAMSEAPSGARARFYLPLSMFGGTNALAAMIQETKQNDAGLQDAAIRALANWRDAGALPILLELCRTGKTETHKVLAARGAIRLAEQSCAGNTENIVLWRNILDAAPREEEKQQALMVLRRLQEKEKR